MRGVSDFPKRPVNMRPSPSDFLPALLLLAASIALPPAATARESDRQQPMNVEADDIDAVMADDSESKLLGNVEITQGTLRIAASSATISRAKGDIKRVVLEGAPATMQQDNDEGVTMRANANRIDYDVSAESVVLTGNVAVDQGADTLRGERITYDLKNGRLNASGQGTGAAGRIRMTIQPRPAEAKPDTAPATEAAKKEGDTP
jgi:lipopolysaccharide export system protein LptA